MTIEQARNNLDKPVVYRPAGGSAETGVITAVRGPWVFVLYAGGHHAKATDPGMLTLAEEQP